ncbi:MAG: flippase-like domain-containing protein [Candidatus Aenigmarchaeota archaeon]|nr:flippase-like domain-containing protein [Candidatus Aenigmarchaeota archaeon]
MKKALSIVLGTILFFGVIFFFGGMEIITIISEINIGYFFIALLIQLFIIYLNAERLRIIICSQKYKLGFWRIFKILVSGMAINQLTPVVKAGGEPVKLYYLSKSNLPTTKSGASVVVEITSELISFYVTLVLLVLFLCATESLSAGFLYASIAIGILVIVGFFISFRFMFNKDRIEKFVEKYISKIFKNPNSKMSSRVFSYSLKNLFSDRALCFKIYSISFLCRFLEFIRIYILFYAINFPVAFTLALVVWVLETVFSSIPGLPGGMGIVEGGTISTLIVLGVSATISSSVLLLDRFLNLWVVVIIGVITLHLLNKEFKGKVRY